MGMNETTNTSTDKVKDDMSPTIGTKYNQIDQGIWKQLLLKHLNSSSHVSIHPNQTRLNVADGLSNVTHIQEKLAQSNKSLILSIIHIFNVSSKQRIDTFRRPGYRAVFFYQPDLISSGIRYSRTSI